MSLSIDISRFETERFQTLCDFVNYENFPNIPMEAMERLHRILIQAQGGQVSRPRVMFKIARSMIEHDLTEEEMQDIYALGWVMELLQFAILASDDIVDKDLWRRGRWAWHCQPGVGQGAVFDTFVGAFLALAFLKKRFQNHPAYLDMVGSINHEILFLQLYQSFDTMVANQGPGNVSTFCAHKLRDMSLGLCGYYYLPIALVLHYAGCASPENLRRTREITNEMAVYYQSQNDFLDLYGDRSKNGKGGRDIRENKCSWHIVEALKICNEDQRAGLNARYGRVDEESVTEVKQIFNDLNMPEAFKTSNGGTQADRGKDQVFGWKWRVEGGCFQILSRVTSSRLDFVGFGVMLTLGLRLDVVDFARKGRSSWPMKPYYVFS